MAIPKKYDIYERKTAAKNVNDSDPRSNSGEKGIEKKERISSYQPMLLGNRHKKSFKYLWFHLIIVSFSIISII